MDINNAASTAKRYALFTLKNVPVLFYCLREELDRLPKALGEITLLDEPRCVWYMEGYAAESGLPLVMWTVRQVGHG